MFIVWTKIFKSDNADEATEAAGLVRHANVQHFYDPQGRVSRRLAPLLGMPTLASVIERFGEQGEQMRKYYSAEMVNGPPTMYDTYVVYPPAAQWHETPPAPVDWMTQLDPTVWVGIDVEHFQHDLPAALRQTVATHTNHPETPPIN